MLIIFDLDGVLLDARDIHFNALNQAAQFWSDGIASYEEHLQHLDGLPTKEKLKWFTFNKGTPPDTWGMIFTEKQRITLELIGEVGADVDLRLTLEHLVDQGHKLACVSNSIDATVKLALDRLGIADLFDYVAGTNDLNNKKPHPECYIRAMALTGHEPSDTFIVEDSPPGREAAGRSGARVIPVAGPHEVTAERILAAIERPSAVTRWDTDWTIVIPMAGAGSRFSTAGYTFPKPLIEVEGRPMIQAVVENLGFNGKYVFIVQREHYDRYHLKALLGLIAPGCEIVITDGMTEGAACTVALARDYVDPDFPVLVANSDQIIEWSPSRFAWATEGLDGLVPTHTATHPKWSFAEVDDDGFVQRVVEKQPISDVATCGIYWWKTGSQMFQAIDAMIEADDRVNNEFYLAPTYNYAIREGGKVRPYSVEAMHGIGTPEDLETYLRRDQ